MPSQTPTRMNPMGQPIGAALPDWTAALRPTQQRLSGDFATLTALDPAAHGDDLFAAFLADKTGAMWTYMPAGPFADRAAFDAELTALAHSTDPLFYAIINPATGRAEGFASYLRIAPDIGTIEVGWITMSPRLQRTPTATQAMYLMMAHAFDDLGYRRYEWKCDALNAKSKAAAIRFGFQPEGVFRQAMIYKGRNRDTAWFSILDHEWPMIKAGFERWLAPANFDANGQQIKPLITRP